MTMKTKTMKDLGGRSPGVQLVYWRQAMPRPEGPLHPSRPDPQRDPGPDVPETLAVHVGDFRLDLADGGKLPPKLVADVLGAKRPRRRAKGSPAKLATIGGRYGQEGAYRAAMSSGSWAPRVDPVPEPVSLAEARSRREQATADRIAA